MKGRLKDIFRAKGGKRKLAEMWKVIFDRFPPFLICKKKRTEERTDRQMDQRTDKPSYRDAMTHLKMVWGQKIGPQPKIWSKAKKLVWGQKIGQRLKNWSEAEKLARGQKISSSLKTKKIDLSRNKIVFCHPTTMMMMMMMIMMMMVMRMRKMVMM